MDKNLISQMYKDGKLTSDGVLNSINKGWLTLDEVQEILGQEDALGTAKAAKLLEISKACGSTIVHGIDLEINGETVHFNLSIEDQSNINNLFRVVELGGTEFPYQSDGGVCKIYNAQEIVQIYLAAQSWITSQTTYHNALKTYIQSLEDPADVLTTQYGMDLPAAYAEEVAHKLAVAQAQIEVILNNLTNAAGA